MHDWNAQSHVTWDGKYHVVIAPEYRKALLYGRTGAETGDASALLGLGHCVRTTALDEATVRHRIREHKCLESGQADLLE